MSCSVPYTCFERKCVKPIDCGDDLSKSIMLNKIMLLNRFSTTDAVYKTIYDKMYGPNCYYVLSHEKFDKDKDKSVYPKIMIDKTLGKDACLEKYFSNSDEIEVMCMKYIDKACFMQRVRWFDVDDEEIGPDNFAVYVVVTNYGKVYGVSFYYNKSLDKGKRNFALVETWLVDDLKERFGSSIKWGRDFNPYMNEELFCKIYTLETTTNLVCDTENHYKNFMLILKKKAETKTEESLECLRLKHEIMTLRLEYIKLAKKYDTKIEELVRPFGDFVAPDDE